MAVTLTSTDELSTNDTKPAFLWPKGADKSTHSPLEAVFWKCPDKGDVIIGYDDPEELDDMQLDIQLEDGNNSKYSGTFNSDGLLII